MSNPIKISPEEINELNKLKETIQRNIFEFGELYMEKIELDSLYKTLSEKELQLRNKTDELKKQESSLMNVILSKYGEGSLNIANGTFVPK